MSVRTTHHPPPLSLQTPHAIQLVWFRVRWASGPTFAQGKERERERDSDTLNCLSPRWESLLFPSDSLEVRRTEDGEGVRCGERERERGESCGAEAYGGENRDGDCGGGGGKVAESKLPQASRLERKTDSKA